MDIKTIEAVTGAINEKDYALGQILAIKKVMERLEEQDLLNEKILYILSEILIESRK